MIDQGFTVMITIFTGVFAVSATVLWLAEKKGMIVLPKYPRTLSVFGLVCVITLVILLVVKLVVARLGKETPSNEGSLELVYIVDLVVTACVLFFLKRHSMPGRTR